MKYTNDWRVHNQWMAEALNHFVELNPRVRLKYAVVCRYIKHGKVRWDTVFTNESSAESGYRMYFGHKDEALAMAVAGVLRGWASRLGRVDGEEKTLS